MGLGERSRENFTPTRKSRGEANQLCAMSARRSNFHTLATAARGTGVARGVMNPWGRETITRGRRRQRPAEDFVTSGYGAGDGLGTSFWFCSSAPFPILTLHSG